MDPVSTDPIKALSELLAWAREANNRLAFEMDRATGFQFGGNPYCNRVFNQAQAALSAAPDEHETADR